MHKESNLPPTVVLFGYLWIINTVYYLTRLALANKAQINISPKNKGQITERKQRYTLATPD
jgi:multidrug resistance efflux pump